MSGLDEAVAGMVNAMRREAVTRSGWSGRCKRAAGLHAQASSLYAVVATDMPSSDVGFL